MVEIVYIIVTIGLTIFVHEFGHFVAAKKLGIKVEKFSIGWGPQVMAFKRGDTEYIISLLVFLGGYVKMAGEAPQEAEKAGEGGFLNQPPWKKIIISSAGVVQNAIFAVVLMWVVFLFGAETLRPVVDEVSKEYPAYKAGIVRGDEITKINGEEIKYWNQITDIIAKSKGAEVTIGVLRGSKPMEFKIKPVMKESEDIIKDKKVKPFIGISPLSFLPVVDDLKKDYPAQAAGILKGDVIKEIDGKKIQYWADATEAIKGSKGRAIKVVVERVQGPGSKVQGGELKTFVITPKKEMIEDEEKKKTETYLLGIVPMSNTIKEKYTPLIALGKAGEQTWFFTELTVKSIYKMISRQIEPDVAGPIGVAQIAYKVAKTGLINLLLLVSIININLALFNLLPLVPFDGGMIVIFLIEAISGRKVPLRAQEIMMEIGWALVILLIVVVTYNDILRIIKGG